MTAQDMFHRHMCLYPRDYPLRIIMNALERCEKNLLTRLVLRRNQNGAKNVDFNFYSYEGLSKSS